MHGIDGIIFTAGVGENSYTMRERVLKGLEFMGVYWDPSLNQIRGKEAFVNYPHSPVKVMVIPTNEEVMIARDTVEKDYKYLKAMASESIREPLLFFEHSPQ